MMKTNCSTLLLALTFCGCGSSSSYQTASPTDKKLKPVQSIGAENASGSGQRSETFTTETSTGKVDIAWFVDQSGSMTREAAHVQNNLANFFNSVNQKVDARYALVASSTQGNVITIPVKDAIHLQIDQFIASNNALEIAISTFIAADIPAQPLLDPNNPRGGRVKKSPVQGALQKFFRPDVLPVVVIVTDDNARNVTDKNFLALAKDAIGREPKVYAWRGNKNLPTIAGAQCDVAADGIAYENLASATGGEVFNLCEPDWKNTFSKLTENIVMAAKNSFTLSKAAKSIVSVSVDGRKVDTSKVVLSGKSVTIPQAELALNKDSKVVINYLPL